MGEIDIQSLSLAFWQNNRAMFYLYFNKSLWCTSSAPSILLGTGCLVNKTCMIVPSWSLYLGEGTKINIHTQKYN